MPNGTLIQSVRLSSIIASNFIISLIDPILLFFQFDEHCVVLDLVNENYSQCNRQLPTSRIGVEILLCRNVLVLL